MLDVSLSYNKFRFIGNEFLTWILFLLNNKDKYHKIFQTDIASLSLGNKLIIENRQKNSSETVLIKGENANFKESMPAFKKGSLVSVINLIYSENEKKWQFTIKAESLAILNLKHPDIGFYESKEDLGGFVLDKTFHINKAVEYIDNLFMNFIKLRVSKNWALKVFPEIKNWINS